MNKDVILLVLVAAAASLTCMHLVSQLHDERARTETLQTRIAELQRAVAERDRAATALSGRASPFSPFSGSATELTQPSVAQSTPLPPEPEAATPTPDRGAQLQEHFARRRELMQDPTYREAVRKQQRVHMDAMYPGLAEALALTDDEKNRFLDLLSQQQTDEMAKASESMAWDINDRKAIEAMHDAVAERQKRYQQEIEAQFGPNVRQKWTEYQETLGHRHRVAALQSQLALAGTPLDTEQSKAVLNVLVEEQRRQVGGPAQANASVAGAFVPFPGAVNTFDTDLTEWMQNQERSHERMLSALQSNLTPEQIERLEGIFSREREAQRASMELMRAQGMNGGNVFVGTGGFAPAAGFAITTVETKEAQETSEQ